MRRRIAVIGALRPTDLGSSAGLACAALLAVGGCLDVGAFPCARDDQCVLDTRSGQCADGYCAFADPECETGLRYHASAASDLAGACVPALQGSSGPEPGTTSGLAPTSGEPTSDTDAGGSSTSGALPVDPSTSTGPSSCGDHPCACAVHLSAGDSSTCALRDDATVVCWGENDDDQLGTIGKVDASPWPLKATLPASIVALVAGNDHHCAVTDTGTAYCWGRNLEGMASPELAPSDVAPPAEVTWLDGVSALGLGPQLTCGSDGSGIGVHCWGDNDFGELGVLDVEGPGPLPIGPPLDRLAIQELAAGRDHVCALADGVVYCWGINQNGQLGTGAPVAPDPVPAAVMLPAPVLRIAAGRRHTCAVLDPGDDVMCWGRNDLGQIGAGTTNFKHDEPIALAAELDAMVVDLRATLDGTCVLTELGTLVCWGANRSDKLGLGGEVTFTAEPVTPPAMSELPEPAVEVAMGDTHVCVRTDTGRVFCWGDDTYEQLGPIDPAPGMRTVEIDLECERQ